MKVEGKASVYAQLEAEREAWGRPKEKAASPASGAVCWRQLQTTRHHTSGGVTIAVASSAGTATASAQDSDAAAALRAAASPEDVCTCFPQ